ncbi:MAG: Nramp family divalent metal transporter [Bryobacterales bacterium]|nr:Nramp family divalent metal transporter [Bryobacterales bacterium]
MSATTSSPEASAGGLHKDLYALDPRDIETPPQGFWNILRRIGPGMILAASIVGSGELIATTTLGAEVGYVCLWVILLSCVVKPALQAEIGRYSIATGQTGLAGFNRIPGPRVGVNWVVWGWAAMITMTRFQIGAMFGGVAQTLHMLIPGVPVNVFVVLLLGVTLLLLLGGGYERIEGLATIKVGLFTMLTFLCSLILLRSPGFSWNDLATGLEFKLPPGGLTSAVAVFGITGVGASELFMYPYWCVEKGYARKTGARPAAPSDAAAWRTRAFGWVRVMNMDILASMLIYTIATIAFYLLGAGVLHTRGLVPASSDMIPVLSNMYTQTLGGWSVWLFYLGAVATLYGTIFAATAAESRVAADLCRLLGRFEADDYQARLRYRRRFVWILTSVSAGLYLLVQSPVSMVKAGGVAQAIMLPVIAVGALFLRYRLLPPEVRPPAWQTIGLWVAALATVSLMAYYTFLLLK